jgi:hypothetical protein
MTAAYVKEITENSRIGYISAVEAVDKNLIINDSKENGMLCIIILVILGTSNFL